MRKYIKITYENGLFAKLFVAYATVITLYYYNNKIANIINIFLTLGVVVLLNKSILGVIAEKLRDIVIARRKVLGE